MDNLDHAAIEAGRRMCDAALGYLARGWSVLPLCPPTHVGTRREHRGCNSPGKRPFFPDRPNSGEWKEFQARLPREDEVRRWFALHPLLNLGAALGPVSGLVGVDVDDEDGDRLLAEMSGGDLPATWEYSTGKGRRLLYALPPGVTVVSQSFRRPGTEIEILRLMGQGSQVVLPPSVHPNGATYRWRALHGPDDIPAAPAPGWMRGGKVADGATATRPADGELITEGGRNNYLTSLAGAMRKRGADAHVISAALAACNETRLDPPLPAAEVEAIVRSVCRYEPDEFTGVTIGMPEPGRVPTVAPGGERRFMWASELAAAEKNDEWVWEGYLPRGGVTLISAHPKAGKTTILAHGLAAFGSDGVFLGQPVKASRVLYVSEEGSQHWVRRRDALGIGDHVGFYLQPFGAKPDPAAWLVFIGQLRADVIAHRFDLVVFDTIAKLWPVKDENDAPGVDAALMPLWELTKAGAGVLLIHHLRKSGGGGDYTGSRGSGALAAFPDILVELTRFDANDRRCNKRVLGAKGRYDETPDELVVELTQRGYVVVKGADDDQPGGAGGTTVAADGSVTLTVADRLSAEDRKVLKVLQDAKEPWLGLEAVKIGLKAKKMGFRNEDVAVVLASLVGRGKVAKRGKKQNPQNPEQYALASRADSTPTLPAPPCQNGEESPGDTDYKANGTLPRDSSPPDTGGREESGKSGDTDEEVVGDDPADS